MVLSDRQHAAQVRIPASDLRSRVLFFDDLGCAVIWLQQQDDVPGTEIWVNDWRDGNWIDARSAHYLAGQHTPMGYGLGAQSEPAPEAIGFDQAREQILAQETGHHRHATH